MSADRLIVRKEHIICTVCFSVELINAGEGTTMSALLVAYEGCVKAAYQLCPQESESEEVMSEPTPVLGPMSNSIPILVVGDSPNITGGLARIARDIAARLHQDSALLNISVAQAGIRYSGAPYPWRVYPINDEGGWGEKDLARIWEWHSAGKPGVVLSVWDPARCFPLSTLDLPDAQLWGYFAVDSETEKGGFGGPAAEAVKKYSRVLGYGAWGAGVLRKVVGPGRKISWLPHGLETASWANDGWENRKPGVRVLGCVAANQPRKDLGLLFSAADRLRRKPGWEGLSLWLHTDFLTKSWSVTELAMQYGWNNQRLLVTTGGNLDDAGLARMYGVCSVTFGCGLGEGFGYPLVESLAAGTPVVHGNFGGGAEWVPRQEWLVNPVAERLEGIYALRRPVFDVDEVVEKLAKAGEEKERDTLMVQEYCKGAVAALDWEPLWSRWRSWMKSGLVEMKGKA